MLPPTSHLPPIKAIKSLPFGVLQNGVEYVSKLYIPPVRGSLRRTKRTNPPPTTTCSEPQIPDYCDAKFEREYAMRWVTALITHHGSDHDEDGVEVADDHHRENLIRSAASLLATCAGTASAGLINRIFAFETPPPANKAERTCASRVVIELRDMPLDNGDYRSLGAQTWGGACVMAEMIAEDQLSFGIPTLFSSSPESPPSFRCIELGAGTGLVSLVIGKLLEDLCCCCCSGLPLSCKTREVEIVATDYYPAVLDNLQRNIHVNFTNNTTIKMRSSLLDWSIFSSSNPTSDPPMLRNTFDVAYGADIVYESRHAQWIKSCLEKLLRRPSQDTVTEFAPTFHLIIPLRKTHVVESNTIEQAFRKATQKNQSSQRADDCNELVIKHRETILCDSGNDGTEKVEYLYYKIGWGT